MAENEGEVVGLYSLHPNNVGRCGHICNASYAVKSGCRGLHIGEALVRDCLVQAGRLGFTILQFNAVVESNLRARRLYTRLGFTQLGVIPGGFRMKDGTYENICPYYIECGMRNSECGVTANSEVRIQRSDPLPGSPCSLSAKS